MGRMFYKTSEGLNSQSDASRSDKSLCLCDPLCWKTRQTAPVWLKVFIYLSPCWSPLTLFGSLSFFPIILPPFGSRTGVAPVTWPRRSFPFFLFYHVQPLLLFFFCFSSFYSNKSHSFGRCQKARRTLKTRRTRPTSRTSTVSHRNRKRRQTLKPAVKHSGGSVMIWVFFPGTVTVLFRMS